jgi:hypothetical protein
MSSPHTTWVIKSLIAKRKRAYRSFVGKPEGKRHMKDLDVAGRMIL